MLSNNSILSLSLTLNHVQLFRKRMKRKMVLLTAFLDNTHWYPYLDRCQELHENKCKKIQQNYNKCHETNNQKKRIKFLPDYIIQYNICWYCDKG